MNKEEILEKVFSMDFTEPVPSTTMKSELFFLTSDEFEKLYKHKNGGASVVNERDYDTIIIGNVIFKKSI